MRKLTIILALLAVFRGGISQETLPWSESYPDAFMEAKQENKIIVMCFMGSDWCPWCIKMNEEIFLDSKFIDEVEDQFVFLLVDFPREKKQPEELRLQNESLLTSYHVIGYPMLILVHPDKGEVARLGYLPIGGKGYAEKILKYAESY